MKYEAAVKQMTRLKLEEYTVAATKTLERLEHENDQLCQDIQSAKMVDMDVIKGWRRWSQIVDEEREKWANTATRLTGEKEHLTGFMNLVEKASEDILVALKDIGQMATDDSEDGTNQKAMRKTLHKIAKLSKEACQSYDKSFQKSDDSSEDTAPEPDDSPQLPEPVAESENPQDDQVATDVQH